MRKYRTCRYSPDVKELSHFLFLIPYFLFLFYFLGIKFYL
jgi:hypothetical protein